MLWSRFAHVSHASSMLPSSINHAELTDKSERSASAVCRSDRGPKLMRTSGTIGVVLSTHLHHRPTRVSRPWTRRTATPRGFAVLLAAAIALAEAASARPRGTIGRRVKYGRTGIAAVLIVAAALAPEAQGPGTVAERVRTGMLAHESGWQLDDSAVEDQRF